MRYLVNDCTDACRNMAFDEFALESLPLDEPVFYLWRNAPSVIIGLNQSHKFLHALRTYQVTAFILQIENIHNLTVCSAQGIVNLLAELLNGIRGLAVIKADVRQSGYYVIVIGHQNRVSTNCGRSIDLNQFSNSSVPKFTL